MSGLVLERITHAYTDGAPSIDGLDLSIDPGALVCLLGASGCGKSTLLKIVAGHLAPKSGRVLLDGKDRTATPPERREIGMVFQSYALFPHLSALDNVAFGLEARGVSARERRRRAAAALAQVGLDVAASTRRPAELSGGQQQRVAVARALVIEPQLLLLDEPFANLDRSLRQRLRDELRALHRQIGVTTLLVTHDQEEALAVADSIAMLDAGRLLAYDTPRALYAQPPSAAIARQLGDANLLRVEAIEDERWMLQGGVPLARLGRHAVVGQLVLLRPEWIELGSGPLHARVHAVRFDGADEVVDVVLSGGATLRARSRDRGTVAGSSIALRLSAERSFLLPTP